MTKHHGKMSHYLLRRTAARQLLHSPRICRYIQFMRETEISFHIARQAGLEFVFNSGRVVAYPMHTHLSVYTVTLVRRGTARVLRGNAARLYAAGEAYVDAPGEPHAPAYSDGHALISLCLRKDLFRTLAASGLRALCLKHARGLMDRRLLRPEDLAALLDGVAGIYRRLPPDASLGHKLLPCPCPEACADSAILPGAAAGLAKLSGAGAGPAQLPDADAGSAQLPDADAGPDVVPDLPRLSGGEGQPTSFPGPESAWRFLRRFKRATGLTPHQYAVQSRLRVAKKLLCGPMPIAEAAALAGFYDQSHLNRWFNRCLGLTPRAYRESCFFLD